MKLLKKYHKFHLYTKVLIIIKLKITLRYAPNLFQKATEMLALYS